MANGWSDMDNDLAMEKAALRRQLRARWRESCPEDRAAAGEEIAAGLAAWMAGWSPRGPVLWYMPLADEVDLRRLVAAARDGGWPCLLPRVAGSTLEIYQWDGGMGELTPGAYGIMEPDPRHCRRTALHAVAVAVIPGLAFDPETGVRLGRGAGYYDRLLADPEFRAVCIGVARTWQLLGPLPREAHDRGMHMLATPAGVRPVPGTR